MSRYVQCGYVRDGEVNDNYMGSAEFEFGSVQLARQLLRFGNTKSRVLDEVYYKDPNEPKKKSVEKLVMIAIDADTPYGNLFDRAIRNFHYCIQKAYNKSQPGSQLFKEPPRLEYSVGMVGSADLSPKAEKLFSRWCDMNFWMSVDYGVHARGFTNGFDEEEGKRNVERYLEAVRDREDERPVWVVCRYADFKAIVQSMAFPKLIAPGLQAIDPNTIRMFDVVKYRTKDGELTAKVVGLLEKGVRVERNGERFVIDEESIVAVVEEKKRA